MSDETLTQNPDTKIILEAIAELSKRTGNLETRFSAMENQLEIIREGIVYNNSKFDRLEGTVYSLRSDISHLKANVNDLTEEVHQVRKGNLITLEK